LARRIHKFDSETGVGGRVEVSLAVYCGGRLCNHSGVLDVSDYADDVPVPAFGPRMVCMRCGAIGADARPNWNERARAAPLWTYIRI